MLDKQPDYDIDTREAVIKKALEKFPKARQIAVENFLATAPLHIGMSANLMNMEMDARLYSWKQDTVNAIRYGLRLLYQSAPVAA